MPFVLSESMRRFDPCRRPGQLLRRRLASFLHHERGARVADLLGTANFRLEGPSTSTHELTFARGLADARER